MSESVDFEFSDSSPQKEIAWKLERRVTGLAAVAQQNAMAAL
jgi:hypothetical protein